MIQLTRTTDTKLLPKSLAGKLRIKKNQELLKQKIQILKGEAIKFEFKSQYWKAAKDAVKAESFNKCAYCESPTAVVAHGDIEHFRPKSSYWWLAYTFHNYCYCCQICNQIYKSDNFPIGGKRWPEPSVTLTTAEDDDVLCSSFGCDPITATEGLSLKQFIALHKKEKPGLPDPYLDKPEKFFSWVADDTLKEVRIVPKSGSAVNKSKTKAVEDFFGLNRKELNAERYRVYDILKKFILLSRSQHLSAADKKLIKEEIKNMTAAGFPYAGMCRFFSKKL